MAKIESINFKRGVKLWPKNVIGFGGMKADRSGKTAGDIYFIFYGEGAREFSCDVAEPRMLACSATYDVFSFSFSFFFYMRRLGPAVRR